MQELLPVSSLKGRLSLPWFSPDNVSSEVKRLRASAAHFKFSDQPGGKTRDRSQTCQMPQTQYYEQHQSNACPGKMRRTGWCGGGRCAVQTATEQRWSQDPANRHSAPQSGRSRYYSPIMEFAFIHRHCEHTKQRNAKRRRERDEGKKNRRKRSVEEEDGRRRGGWQHGKEGMHVTSVIAPA